ncbi:MAG TPA: hypothetical protein DDZ51_14455 [Planctomycetaceae bacterium]|nr:hypothetical protein [Planctomycetaceae bacterium]
MAPGVQISYEIRTVATRLATLAWILLIATPCVYADVADQFQTQISPLLARHCMGCHSSEKVAGELNLEQFATIADAKKTPLVWENIASQINDGEMPPKDKPPLTQSEKTILLQWIERFLDEAALETAGDPGSVILRRLSNAEYTHSIRDLTGVTSLEPAREFPADGAAGEGFTNASAALVMSPTMLNKYLDAAKAISKHVVLVPSGIEFSPSVSASDWANERLAAIRAFYGRHSRAEGATAVNLQGIQFDTNQGGRLPLEAYMDALIKSQDALGKSKLSISQLATEKGLNAKYLNLLYETLQKTDNSLLLADLNRKWQSGELTTDDVRPWQENLWRFTSVGHIGKVNGPKSWQEPVYPLVASHNIRMPLQSPQDGSDLLLYLSTGDAGDGNDHDIALWENPRLAIPGQADLSLRDLRSTWQRINAGRNAIVADTTKYLSAIDEISRAPQEKVDAKQFADENQLSDQALANWLDILGVHVGRDVPLEPLITGRLESTPDYSFVKGWTGSDALGVLANSSDADVRVPGLLRAHSVAVHPSPTVSVVIAWRCPASTTVTIEGQLFDAHTDCGNGFQWALELRRGRTVRQLANGTSEGSVPIKIGPLNDLRVDEGDAIAIVIGPKDSSHVCDLTAVDLEIRSATQTWNLAKDVSPHILSGNPHADSYQNDRVWFFVGEPVSGGSATFIPPNSLLEKWQLSTDSSERQQLAVQIQRLLETGDVGVPPESGDGKLRSLLRSFDGPLMNQATQVVGQADSVQPLETNVGVDAALFGRHPTAGEVSPQSICVAAPSVIEVRIPAELAKTCELVVDAKLHTSNQRQGSVQMQVTTTRPESLSKTAVGETRASVAKGKWTDNNLRTMHSVPIIVDPSGAARERFVTAFDDFRRLFPLALCYTTIVPVDEVVTLTLYYREDDHLKRLMLDDEQSAELDRLWDNLVFISQSPLKLVDAFEQLYQYATQDADPSAFEPMRAPILDGAAKFQTLMQKSESVHVQAVVDFAAKTWRRPLVENEVKSLTGLYDQLRGQDLSHDAAIRMMLTRVLIAPSFLYRGEQTQPGKEATVIDSWELATRLSYFLWSSVPDEELRRLAASGELNDPRVLSVQVRRMTHDPKIRRWATEFGCQWLHIRDVETLDEKSERHFPTFVDIRGDMQEEAVQFFIDLVQNDRSILSLIDSDHTFVNQRLAQHYQLTVPTPDWQRVEGMRAAGRGGILGFAATLSKQSGASRTSPILRGNWLSEVILGERLPRPPKDVPVLPDEAPQGLTERQLIERHSSDAACRSCHQRIDPYGFALEAFDAIGRRRDRDLAGHAIDTKTQLADGTPLDGIDGVRNYLLTQRKDDFVRQFCRKLIGYSLGRSLELSDKPLLDTMVAQLREHDYPIHVALELVINSPQFTRVRGQDFETQ